MSSPSPRLSIQSTSTFHWSVRSSQSTLTADPFLGPSPEKKHIFATACVYSAFGIASDEATDSNVPWDRHFKRLTHRLLSRQTPVQTFSDDGIAVLRPKCRIAGHVSSVLHSEKGEEIIEWTDSTAGRTSELTTFTLAGRIRAGDVILALDGVGRPVIARMYMDYASLLLVVSDDSRLWPWETKGLPSELFVVWRCPGLSDGEEEQWFDDIGLARQYWVSEVASDRVSRLFNTALLFKGARHNKEARGRFQEVVAALGNGLSDHCASKPVSLRYKPWKKRSHAMNLMDLFMQGELATLRYAARYGLEEVVRLLLRTGIANLYQSEGKAAFILAAKRGHILTARLLLEAENGRLFTLTVDKSSLTPLIRAVIQDNRQAIEQLLDIGDVDLDARDNNGLTALVWALQTKNKAVVDLLLDTGRASPDTKDRSGLSSLVWASLCGGEWYVQRLLDAKKQGRWWRRQRQTVPTYRDMHEYALFS